AETVGIDAFGRAEGHREYDGQDTPARGDAGQRGSRGRGRRQAPAPRLPATRPPALSPPCAPRCTRRRSARRALTHGGAPTHGCAHTIARRGPAVHGTRITAATPAPGAPGVQMWW